MRLLRAFPFAILAATVAAQGPGSCGFHLDVDANLTSTHSAVADLFGAPGSGFAGIAPGASGNPYTAYCTPGTVVTLKLSVPDSVLGPFPFGAGSVISILWAIGTPNIAIIPGVGVIFPCVAGQPIIASVLPFAGAVVDGLAIVGPAPPLLPADPGHPAKLEVSLLYPIFLPAFPPVMFQAVAITPLGAVAISNAVAVIGAPNPFELTLIPGLVPCGAGPALDDGWSLGVPTPPGFTFYGFPAPTCNVSTNGYLDFLPPFPVPPCDLTGSCGDLGCAIATATASPRVAIDHFDIDLGVAAPAPRVTDLTVELAPPGPGWPSRTIVRWKHVVNFGVVPGLPDSNHASLVAELWGMDSFPPLGGRIVGVRQRIHSVSTLGNHDLIGIGPGLAVQGFGGPPPACLVVALAGIYGFPGPVTVPGGGVCMDTAPAVPGLFNSAMLSNLAVSFDPLPFAFPVTHLVSVN